MVEVASTNEFVAPLLAMAVVQEHRIPVAALDVLIERDRFGIRLATDDVVKAIHLGLRDFRAVDAAGPDEMLLETVLSQRVRFVVQIVELAVMPVTYPASRNSRGKITSRLGYSPPPLSSAAS